MNLRCLIALYNHLKVRRDFASFDGTYQGLGSETQESPCSFSAQVGLYLTWHADGSDYCFFLSMLARQSFFVTCLWQSCIAIGSINHRCVRYGCDRLRLQLQCKQRESSSLVEH